MKRFFEKTLQNWKETGMKKPLMVVGARQIGKTFIIDEFGKNNFDEYLYFNLEKNKEVKDIFEKTIDDEKIISEIELYIGKKIDIEKTLIFFDEVQESENCIVSLKYFNESEKPYKIICAGSLLGVKINRFKGSFPVGKVRMEYMYPMNFEEFLLAVDKEMLRDQIKKSYSNMSPMPDYAHEQAITLYRQYLCVGGMPEAIKNFVENDLDILKFDSHIIEDIKDSYIADMKKYVSSELEATKIEKVYKNIPSQLAKDKKNFKYSFIDPNDENARKRKYESAIDWLIASKLILINYKSKRMEIPLKVYTDEDMFKIYLSDVGLLTCMSEIKFPDIMLDKTFIYKGAITENYIAQELASQGESLYYWTSDRNAEIDFALYTDEDGIIPIEVKSGNNVKSVSLNMYIEEFKPKYAIRFSTRNFGFENNIKSIPLYAAFCIK